VLSGVDQDDLQGDPHHPGAVDGDGQQVRYLPVRVGRAADRLAIVGSQPGLATPKVTGPG
jgi:hypothetical protein